MTLGIASLKPATGGWSSSRGRATPPEPTLSTEAANPHNFRRMATTRPAGPINHHCPTPPTPLTPTSQAFCYGGLLDQRAQAIVTCHLPPQPLTRRLHLPPDGREQQDL